MAGMITGPTAGVFMYVFGISLVEASASQSRGKQDFYRLDTRSASGTRIFPSPSDGSTASSSARICTKSTIVSCSRIGTVNFGTNLSIFDWLFRTGYRPAKREQAVFGISRLAATIHCKNSIQSRAHLSHLW